MVLSRKLQRALEVFLKDFASRRTEYRRYWLFGFLVESNLDLQMDLLAAPPFTHGRPVDVARRRAEYVFDRSMTNASVRLAELTSAHFAIKTKGEPIDRAVHGVLRCGQEMTFRISVVYQGTLYEAERMRFVGHHDPAVERKSEPPFDEGEGRDT